MPEDKKKVQVTFAPGAFDHFDGTQEELDEFVAELQRLADSGELLEQSVELTDEMWEQMSEEEKTIITAALSDDEPEPRH